MPKEIYIKIPAQEYKITWEEDVPLEVTEFLSPEEKSLVRDIELRRMFLPQITYEIVNE